MIMKVILVVVGFVGGSSDVVVIFRGLNRLWNLNLFVEMFVEFGVEIGFDVLFCVYGGIVLVIGCGEKIKYISMFLYCWVILVKLIIGVLIVEVYRQLKVDDVEYFDVYGMIEVIEEKSF